MPRGLNAAAVVILYHPETGVMDYIRQISQHFKTFVLDNTEGNPTDVALAISQMGNVIYSSDGLNKGIASRLNQACELAKLESFDWLLTMDQDSVFSESALASYLNCISTFPTPEKVAMFGVSFSGNSEGSVTCAPLSDVILITSGSMVSLSAHEQIGGFDEILFIDYVDTDYCLRSMAAGFNCVLFSNIQLTHSLGTEVHGRSIKTFKITTRTVHSPLRIFYMTKNILHMKHRYANRFPKHMAVIQRDFLIRIKNNLLYGSGKWKILSNIIQGYKRYRKERRQFINLL